MAHTQVHDQSVSLLQVLTQPSSAPECVPTSAPPLTNVSMHVVTAPMKIGHVPFSNVYDRPLNRSFTTHPLANDRFTRHPLQETKNPVACEIAGGNMGLAPVKIDHVPFSNVYDRMLPLQCRSFTRFPLQEANIPAGCGGKSKVSGKAANKENQVPYNSLTPIRGTAFPQTSYPCRAQANVRVPEITFAEFIKDREKVQDANVIPAAFLSMSWPDTKPVQTMAQAEQWYKKLTDFYHEGFADAMKPVGYSALKEMLAVSRSPDCPIKFEYIEFVERKLQALSENQMSVLEEVMTRERIGRSLPLCVR